MRLRPTGRRWPVRAAVECRSDSAAPFLEQYGAALAAGAGNETGDYTILLRDGDEPSEGYTLCFEETRVVCSASSPAGFRHALETVRQIASEPGRPVGTVEDAPSLSVRGFHLNFESYRRMDLDGAIRLLEAAARFKLNTILAEYGPRFPFERHSQVRNAALSSNEIVRLNETAASLGLELIPLQQSFAHLEYVLKRDDFAGLRENPEKHNLICPSNPASLELFKTLAGEMLRGHPRARYLHIGGDEARKIGACPACRQAVEREGRGSVIGRHLGAAARWALERGVRPIVWDDTLCAHPDALSHLPAETVIQYWDYIAVQDPTPVLIPRMAHAGGGPRVAHDTTWLARRRSGRLSDVQIGVMDRYSKPARLKSALGREYLAEFGPYLGKGFPRWLRALPYLEYYQDRGFEVITSPTGMGNGDAADGSPNFVRFEHNIRTHADRCRANGRALGIITACWFNMPPEMLYQPLIRTAMAAW